MAPACWLANGKRSWVHTGSTKCSSAKGCCQISRTQKNITSHMYREIARTNRSLSSFPRSPGGLHGMMISGQAFAWRGLRRLTFSRTSKTPSSKGPKGRSFEGSCPPPLTHHTACPGASSYFHANHVTEEGRNVNPNTFVFSSHVPPSLLLPFHINIDWSDITPKQPFVRRLASALSASSDSASPRMSGNLTVATIVIVLFVLVTAVGILIWRRVTRARPSRELSSVSAEGGL